MAEQVMRVLEPQLQRACPCGGGCPRCRSRQRESLQTKGVQADDAGRIAAPPIVHEVLRSRGEPLDPAARDFMEPRFGYDLSRVRIHVDPEAAESARAVGALAYTVGSDIVFGTGQYAPGTTAGRNLLAHELAHVVRPVPGGGIRRRPTAEETRARRRDAWLERLAERPDEAHREWKRLTSTERVAVIVGMTSRYGEDFARSFLGHTERPVASVFSAFGSNDPHPPEWFRTRGFQLWRRTQGVTRGMVGEYWVHPSGNVIMQLRDDGKADRTSTIPEPPDRNEEECAALEEAVLSILRDSITTETSAKEDLESQKGRLERMNKFADSYGDPYEAYIRDLEGMKSRLEVTTEDVEAMRHQLEEMKCATAPALDDKLQELSELQIWADVESSPMSLQFLRPMKAKLKP